MESTEKKKKEIISVGKNTEDYFPQIELEDLQSMEELYFLWYLCDLKDAGYVEDAWYEDDTFTLGKGYEKEYKVVMKTKTKIKKETVVKPTIYTPDFKIKWTEEAVGVFYMDYVAEERITYSSKPVFSLGMDLTSYIEVKPDFDFNNMTRYAKIKMNWLFQQTGVFTNLVKVPTVFKNTFTPDRYILTDNNKRTRQIKFKIKTIQEFVKTKI